MSVGWLLSVLAIPLFLSLWVHFTQKPVLILATGYGRRYVWEALGQNQDAWRFEPKYYILNWDGERIFVDCFAGLTEASYAPPGALILAALPDGFGVAWHAWGANPYDKMTRPLIIPYWFLAITPLMCGLTSRLWRKTRTAWLAAEGRCGVCGYNLIGNVSGICPECGDSKANLA
jgi:hypothetical protein